MRMSKVAVLPVPGPATTREVRASERAASRCSIVGDSAGSGDSSEMASCGSRTASNSCWRTSSSGSSSSAAIWPAVRPASNRARARAWGNRRSRAKRLACSSARSRAPYASTRLAPRVSSSAGFRWLTMTFRQPSCSSGCSTQCPNSCATRKARSGTSTSSRTMIWRKARTSTASAPLNAESSGRASVISKSSASTAAMHAIRSLERMPVGVASPQCRSRNCCAASRACRNGVKTGGPDPASRAAGPFLPRQRRAH